MSDRTSTHVNYQCENNNKFRQEWEQHYCQPTITQMSTYLSPFESVENYSNTDDNRIFQVSHFRANIFNYNNTLSNKISFTSKWIFNAWYWDQWWHTLIMLLSTRKIYIMSKKASQVACHPARLLVWTFGSDLARVFSQTVTYSRRL